MGATSHVLCKYYLHGACKFGAACAFSHSMADGESQVCKFYLRGECSYGDRCRYMHTKPEWARGRREGGAAAPAGYAAPPEPRPAADDLAEQLPISRLRLGGQALDADAAAGHGGSGSAALPLPLPLPLQLPRDPFGGDGTTGGGDAAAEAVEEQQEQQEYEEGEWEEEGGEYWEEGEGEWYGEGEGEGAYWQQQHGEQEGWHGDEQAGWLAGQPDDVTQQLGGGAQQPGVWSLPEGGGGQPGWAAGGSHPSLRSLCMQWFSSGACGRGDRCQLVHGELCQHCHKHALHPTDAPARQQHLAECRLRHERLAARAASSAVECSICLEAVLSKAAPGERKFGLLTGCDHPFCLRCIRSWRQNTDGSVDIDTALRTCPVCRTTSYYIVPSLVWPTSGEEKERILAGYKAKLSLIDCRYFNFGDGTCPFGTSCFYRHAYHDGRLEDKGLRKAADEEGHIRVMQPVRLSDFIAASTAGQRLGRRR